MDKKAKFARVKRRFWPIFDNILTNIWQYLTNIDNVLRNVDMVFTGVDKVLTLIDKVFTRIDMFFDKSWQNLETVDQNFVFLLGMHYTACV